MRTKIRFPSVTLKDTLNLVRTFCAEAGTPKALAVSLIIEDCVERDGCADELLRLHVDARHYADAESFFLDYQVCELVRKFPGLPLSSDPEQVAREKFDEAEAQCAATNRRLRSSEIPQGRIPVYLARMRKNISVLLGPVTSDLLSRCVTEGGWGKGVTSSCKGQWLTEYHKLQAQAEATPGFAVLAQAIMTDCSPHWGGRGLVRVPGSKRAFVPKDARTHRSIAVEPSANQFLQKGIGLAIRRRLKRRWGIDLHSQERNQLLAHAGSLDGSFATIDLSSASDTVSFEAVRQLFPSDWVQLLNSCRCAFMDCDGERRLLHKWSSMGNGYTFELETAIFAAAVQAVVTRDDWYAGRFAVYGDDIIVPTEAFEELCQLLAYLGFTLNNRKTFASGPFRESCGADWFNGVNVRPFYLKGLGWFPLVNWFNWLRSNRPEFKRTIRHITGLLGKNFPRIPAYSPQVGLWVTPFDSSAVIGNYQEREMRGQLGQPGLVSFGYEWKGLSMSSRQFDGDLAFLAHLRVLERRNLTDLSEPWCLGAKDTGRWVRRRTWAADNIRSSGPWLPPV